MKLLVINGPNMNLLGMREPNLYGKKTYDELVRFIESECNKNGVECECFQSNHEGEIIDRIQSAYGVFDGIIINAAAYTHTSIAIADALAAVCIKTASVHLTDITQREAFRQTDYISPHCVFNVRGKGFEGYAEAVKFFCGGNNL